MPIIEATALHHSPGQSNSREFSPLTAVHVANVLEHENNPGQDGFVDPTADAEYLKELHVDEHLDEWRAMIAGKEQPDNASPRPAALTGQTLRSADRIPRKQPSSARTVALVSLSACAIVSALVTWNVLHRSNPEVVTRRPQAAKPVRPNLASANASPLIAATASAAPGRDAAAVPVAAARVPDAPQTNSPPAESRKVEAKPAVLTGFDAVKIQGVIYTRTNASVVINGQMLHRGEMIRGVRVIEIERGKATLEYENEQRVFRIER